MRQLCARRGGFIPSAALTSVPDRTQQLGRDTFREQHKHAPGAKQTWFECHTSRATKVFPLGSLGNLGLPRVDVLALSRVWLVRAPRPGEVLNNLLLQARVEK